MKGTFKHSSEKWYLEEPFRAFWEKSYRSREVSGMGHPSFEVAEVVPVLPPLAKVLDLGCGEGRNALFLASAGCQVTAVDRSQAGIEKLRFAAGELGLTLSTHVADIADFVLEGSYDLIMAHGVLYYLDNQAWRNLLRKIKEHTKEGGFNIYTVFVYSEDYPCPDEFSAAGYQHSFAPLELFDFYSDWHCLRADQYVKWDEHPDVSMHYHPIEKLVARKSGSADILLEVRELDTGPDCDLGIFESIVMGSLTSDLIPLLGNPYHKETFYFGGEQFGVSHRRQGKSPTVLMKDYTLELWYYGQHAFYIVDGEVTGKALYTSKPVSVRP